MPPGLRWSSKPQPSMVAKQVVVLRWFKEVRQKKQEVMRDAQAGVTLGVESIPDGMASAVLAGVDPVIGVHAAMVSLTVGGFRTSTQLMAVTTTGAMTVAVGSALGTLGGQARLDTLFLLTALIGGIMLLFGILRLGALVRFLSNEAILGFLTGIAVLIVFSQIPDILGMSSQQTNTVLRGIDCLLRLEEANPWAALIGLGTIASIVLLGRTKLANLSMMLSVVLLSAMAALLGRGVDTVGDIGTISNLIPSITIPDPSLITVDLVAWAFLISIVGLTQGASIAQTMPGRHRRSLDPSKDFTAQGWANLASGFLQGMPTGGSISASALVRAAGGRTRLANVLAGLSILLLVLIAGQYLLMLSIPALAGLLIVAAAQIVRRDRLKKTWRTNYEARAVMVLTFAATVSLPIIYAIAAGVLLSAVLFVYKSSLQVSIIEVVPLRGGGFTERRAPYQLRSDSVTILDFHGSLFYGGAWTMERKLPRPEGTRNAVVVFRLHGHTEIGSTFLEVVDRYSRALKENEGRLMIAGAGSHVMRQLRRTGVVNDLGEENVFEEGEVLEDSIFKAYRSGQEWIEGRK